jgi:hypothetical protein
MKYKSVALLFSIAAVVGIVPEGMRVAAQTQALPERDEIRQSYRLPQGARSVVVTNIDGSVDIETTDGDTAEVYIVRSARKRDDLKHDRVFVEQTAEGLVVRGETNGWRPWSLADRTKVRQQVTLKVPRQVDVHTKNVNGRVRIGEVAGSVKVNDVNGGVTVGQALGYAEARSINGGLSMTLSRLDSRGLTIKGINGRIDLRFAEAQNADVQVNGINGGVDFEVPNLTSKKWTSQSKFRAQLGNGGSPINLSNINGRVSFAGPRS